MPFKGLSQVQTNIRQVYVQSSKTENSNQCIRGRYSHATMNNTRLDGGFGDFQVVMVFGVTALACRTK